jgi:hypothetical protein
LELIAQGYGREARRGKASRTQRDYLIELDKARKASRVT